MGDKTANLAFGLMAFANVALAMLLVVRLRTSPADVLAELRKVETRTQLRVDELREKQRLMLMEFDRRGAWMDSQNQKWEELESRTVDRWTKTDHNEWAERLREANRNLVVPD